MTQYHQLTHTKIINSYQIINLYQNHQRIPQCVWGWSCPARAAQEVLSPASSASDSHPCASAAGSGAWRSGTSSSAGAVPGCWESSSPWWAVKMTDPSWRLLTECSGWGCFGNIQVRFVGKTPTSTQFQNFHVRPVRQRLDPRNVCVFQNWPSIHGGNAGGVCWRNSKYVLDAINSSKLPCCWILRLWILETCFHAPSVTNTDILITGDDESKSIGICLCLKKRKVKDFQKDCRNILPRAGRRFGQSTAHQCSRPNYLSWFFRKTTFTSAYTKATSCVCWTHMYSGEKAFDV